jgi:hypothetical protein
MEGYNWTRCDTPENRDRLEQLLDNGKLVTYNDGDKLLIAYKSRAFYYFGSPTHGFGVHNDLEDISPSLEFIDQLIEPQEDKGGELATHLSNALAYPMDYRTHVGKAIELLDKL